MNLVKWFKDIEKEDRFLGDKATTLAELYKHKFPVPNGFCITSEAFNIFVEENRIEEQIKRIIDEVDAENKERLNDASRKIQELILNGSLVGRIKSVVDDSYEKINMNVDLITTATREALGIMMVGKEYPFVVIRSSLDNKKLKNSEIVLNIKGINGLNKGIKKAWANLFTPENLALIKKGEDFSLNLIVQKMIKSDKSGIIYNQENHIFIESIFGIGQPMLKESVKPDQYTLDPETFMLRDKKINEKEFMLNLDINLGVVVVKKNLNNIKYDQVLNDNEIRSLGIITKNVEDYYNSKKELEFAIEGYHFFIINVMDKIKEPFKEQIEEEHIEVVNDEIEEKEGVDTITEVKLLVDSLDGVYNLGDGIGLLDLDRTIDKDYLDKKYELINEIYYKIKSTDLKDKPIWYKLLDVGDEFISLRGIRKSLNNVDLLRAEIEAIKRLHDEGLNNVGIVLPMVTNIGEIRKVKEILKEFELEPLENIELGVIIETPAAVQIIKEICEEDIDFVSINLENLTQFSLVLDKNKEDIALDFYDEMHPAILRQIQNVVNVCKENNIEINVFSREINYEEMVEFLVNVGIDSITVKEEDFDVVKEIINKSEKRLLLKAARKGFKV